MLPLVELVTVLAMTFFAGAAIYINLVEHPARMACSTELAATVWAPSYKRATAMQAPLAAVGFLAGIRGALAAANGHFAEMEGDAAGKRDRLGESR